MHLLRRCQPCRRRKHGSNAALSRKSSSVAEAAVVVFAKRIACAALLHCYQVRDEKHDNNMASVKSRIECLQTKRELTPGLSLDV